MFVGAYWAERQESREEAAERVAHFLSSLAKQNELLSKWFLPARSKAVALRRQIAIDPETVAKRLNVNRGDFDGEIIPEIGFSLGLWNGRHTSFSATIGAYSPYILNTAVLSFDENSDELKGNDWKNILVAMVQAFDPDHAVVTSSKHRKRAGAKKPWDAGWFTYERGGEICQHPFDIKRS